MENSSDSAPSENGGTPTVEPRRLPAPLPYHFRLQRFLAREYPEIWRWFSSDTFRHEAREELRLELLKTTYRLSPEDHPELHARVEKTLQALGLDAPWTLYQSQGDGSGANAALAYMPGEVHMIFFGDMLSLVDDEELDVLLGHELTHFYFYELENHDFFTSTRVLRALANDEPADPSHLESLRLEGLHTEILADRGAFSVTGNLDASVRLLVKTSTGATTVNAESYLKQADEIFGHGDIKTDGITHPEVFIRARALELWSTYVDDPGMEPADLEEPIGAMIHGRLRFDSLDLLGQEELRRQTFRLIRRLLDPHWMRTDAAVAHARLFFGPTPVFQEGEADAPLPTAHHDEELARYFAYVLTDFVALTRDLEDGAVAAAFARAGELGIDDLLSEILHKELRITKTVLKRIRRDTPSILSGLGGGESTSQAPEAR